MWDPRERSGGGGLGVSGGDPRGAPGEGRGGSRGGEEGWVRRGGLMGLLGSGVRGVVVTVTAKGLPNGTPREVEGPLIQNVARC